MDEAAFDFDKLTREIIAGRVAELEKNPESVAEVAKELLVSMVRGSRAKQDPRVTVASVVRGLMNGLLLINQPLPAAATATLGALAAAAQELQLDPGEMMTWAMEGLATVARTAGLETEGALQQAIEDKFMGAGAVFNELCRKAAG